MGDTTWSRSNRPETRQHGYDSTETSSDDERHRDGSRCSSEGSDSDFSLDGEYGHVVAANDNERRAAVEGTFARSEHQHAKSGNGHFNKDRDYGRDNRQRQYGPCVVCGSMPHSVHYCYRRCKLCKNDSATCGSMPHSVHYCYRRCKLCKKVHDAGKCDALNEPTNLLRSKVDKKDLTPELQSLVFGNHLN
ncbi:Hypothetical protein PHPALM_10311 [Phytophthora palmivora]|uniref:Uncharacterized protein n=1 Tax=Phytophthora palmivora TaxID=4796 RepID=A0A2P4Y506_9STRA|nr:Hypothetical protein PHPALM_10311 [Phytophthora palmivora]